jgi:AcrR family transcriptional regulator
MCGMIGPMSPTPARTSSHAILAAARAVLEDDGLDGLTMQAVAARVGVRAPSLYKHVVDRAALIRGVADAVVADLEDALAISRPSAEPGDDLRAIARRYRAFVRANPAGYGLLFADLPAGAAPDPGRLALLARPILETVARVVGESDALPAARTFVAWAHGFTSMERAGAFRLGGDIDAAYAAGVDVILRGISGPVTPAST